MSTTYEIVIYGKVQHVGFRDRIEYIGKVLGIDGIVYNYKDGTVRILANFDSERKKRLFKELIKELEEVDKLIKINKIEERELKTFVEFPEGINRISADDLIELNKKLDEGVKYIKLIFNELEGNTKILNTHTEILNKQMEILKYQNKLLEKLDKKLEMHTKILEEMDKNLDNLEKGQNEVIKVLNEIKEILKK